MENVRQFCCDKMGTARFSQDGTLNGKDVVIAIIDSGIDSKRDAIA